MLALSDKWAPVLLSQPETGMDYQVACIILADGRKFENVVIVGGYITRVGEHPDIPFSESDIVKIEVTPHK